jgi:ribokinase
VDTKFINVIKSQKNGAATVLGTNEDNIATSYLGANQFLTTEIVAKNLKFILESEIILTQFEIPLTSIELITKRKNKNNIFILNPSPLIDKKNYSHILNEVDILIMNETEFKNLSGVKSSGLKELKKGSEILLKIGVKNIVVTLGDKGVFVKNNKLQEYINVRKVEVVSTAGAGDVFTGAFAYYYLSNKDVVKSAISANDVASLSITRPGTSSSIPTQAEVDLFKEKLQTKIS